MKQNVLFLLCNPCMKNAGGTGRGGGGGGGGFVSLLTFANPLH